MRGGEGRRNGGRGGGRDGGRGGGRDGGRGCPLCGQPAEARFQPFCSRRCADEDLGRWLRGSYAIPTDEPPEDGGGAGEGEED